MKDLHNRPTNTDCPSPTAPYVVLCEHPVAITNSKLVNAIMNGHVIHQQDVYGKVYATDWQFVRQNVNFRFISRFIKRYINLHGDIFGFVDITTGEYYEPVMYVPCGKCDLCRDKRRKQIAVMCQMECQMHYQLPIFITLTYDNSTLPPDGLDYRDFQLFMSRLRKVYREYGVPTSDWKPLRYCVSGEYGDDAKYSGRPHWHALIWDFPTYLFKELGSLDKYIRKVWKDGLTDTQRCYSGDTGYYIGKYIAKNEIPEGCVKKPFVRHSANLGVDFVKGVCQKIMTENPTFTDFKYKDRFTGHLKQLPLIMYYIKKMFPTINAVKPEVREAVRCYNALCDISPIFEKFDIDPKLRGEFTYGDYYAGLNLADDTDVISRTLYLMADLDGKIVPDYAKNRSIIDQYLNFLFVRLGDQDVAALAYNVKKKNANERCYRRDKKIKYQKYEY